MAKLKYNESLTHTAADMDKLDWAFSHGRRLDFIYTPMVCGISDA